MKNSVYVWGEDRMLIDIVTGVSTRRLLDVIERRVMKDNVQMLEVAYGNEVYTAYVRR